MKKKISAVIVAIVIIICIAVSNLIKSPEVRDLNCYKVGLNNYELTLFSDFNENTLKEQMLLSPAIILKDRDGEDITVFVNQIQYFSKE